MAATGGQRRCERVFNVPVGAPFLPTLVEAILANRLFAEVDFSDPFALADLTIYLPNRRAARALRETFLRASRGRTLLLPRILPLGEVDEAEMNFEAEAGALAALLDLPPTVSGLERELKLAQLTQPFVAHLRQRLESDVLPVIATPADALSLARALARFLDELETEGVSFDALQELVPQELSEHWSLTLKFLEIIAAHWPQWLAENGLISAAERRNRLMAALAAHYAQGLKRPVIIAGSTGSVPATAGLMQVVGSDPLGAVVLPGLDRALDEASFAGLVHGERPDHGHPQHGLARLLTRLGCSRAAVTDLGEGAPARARLIAEALRPAETLESWAEAGSLPEAACSGIAMLEAETPHEEALAIALAMRHAAEAGQSAQLVTPDRGLARRVAVELARWQIEVDDSAGTPLSQTPPGVFLRLLCEVMAGPFDAAALTALLKHPLLRLAMPAGAARRGARAIELAALRGFGPFAGLADVAARFAATRQEARGERAYRLHHAITSLATEAWEAGRELLERLVELQAEVSRALAAADGRLQPMVQAVQTAAETASRDEAGTALIHAREAGEALDRLLAELAACDHLQMQVRPRDLAALMETIMAPQAVRRRFPSQHDLHIYGLLEARLQGADLTILGGLNEGVWPDVPQNDPWLSRPMRAEVGLPPPERRIGLAAHDFAQGLASPRVILTRALKDAGGPCVASRWWQRLDAYIAGSGRRRLVGRNEPHDWLALARGLRRVERARPVCAPAPRPPLALRPRQLSVTSIETWQRNPYAIHARHVLGLSPLEPLGVAALPARRGTLLHAIFEDFGRRFPDEMPPQALERLIEIGERHFADVPEHGETTFWWPRFLRAAAWFVEKEKLLRQDVEKVHVELSGRMEIPAAAGPFILTGRADRIDRLTDGRFAIYDYKTGETPSTREVEVGFAPQLSLEVAMLAHGGFVRAGLSGQTARIGYLSLSGGRTPGRYVGLKEKSPQQVAEEALDGLSRLIARFDEEATAYEALRRPKFAYRYDDYAHLARVKEWHGAAGEAGDD